MFSTVALWKPDVKVRDGFFQKLQKLESGHQVAEIEEVL
jgi:hypothetical protein